MITALYVMIAIWGLIVTAFVAVMVYRGHLTQHETDQLFLSESAPSFVHSENDEVIRRVNRVQPFVKFLGIACVLLTILIIGVWIAQMLSHL